MSGAGADHRDYDIEPDPRGPSTPECREVIGQLYVYLDGELTDERRAAVRQHLDHCGSCLEAFEFEAELRTVISERSRIRVPEHLLARLAEALRNEAAKDRQRSNEGAAE